MYSFFVDDSSEHKKAMGVYRNVIATIIHYESYDVLLNKKCLRHSVNRIQSKDHKIKTCEINKISLPWFDGKICIQKLWWISSRLSGLIKKISYLISI